MIFDIRSNSDFLPEMRNEQDQIFWVIPYCWPLDMLIQIGEKDLKASPSMVKSLSRLHLNHNSHICFINKNLI